MQKTIKGAVQCGGIDIFGQNHTTITLLPAPVNSGIVFVRIDLSDHPQVCCNSDHLLVDSRWTVLEQRGIRIEHTEHILATLAGLGVDNVIIKMAGPSVPVVDGYSSTDFVKEIIKVGLCSQPAKRQYCTVTCPCLVKDEFYSDGKRYEKFLLALPCDHLELTYVLDYPDHSVPNQIASYPINDHTFKEELARARSYITQQEYQLVAPLIGKGMQSVLVFSPGQSSDLRWPNEPARHKLVDLLGDLNTIGQPLRGRFIGFRSGHRLNAKMVKKLVKLCR